ncbi:MAG: hypothetical protein NVS1B11_24830 [Terriglobales bacterium]
MFRNLSFAVTILAVTSLSLLSFAQGANDPLLRRQTQSEKRIKKTSSGGPHSTVPPSIPRAKANGVDAQLNQIERQTINQGPTVHRNAYPAVASKTANSRAANQPMNFQYHAAKTATNSQPAGGSGGAAKVGGIHRVR